MKTEKILDQIFASPKGGTAPLHSDELPATGYYVGGVVSPLIMDTSPRLAPYSREDAWVFIDYLEHVACQYVGWWTDGETGEIWVDAVTWHPAEDQAERVARVRREIAFYDIRGDREIRIDYTEKEPS